MATVELFNLTASGPLTGNLHGGGLARAGVHAGATFRRGIDLSAGFDIEAEVDASIRDGVAAAVEAGVGAEAGVALQAAMPLDLFTEAGLVARLQAQAEAAAYVSASVGLELDVFRALVVDRLGPGPLVDALGPFLEEVVIAAGFWARAAFAAEVLGEATLTGSLLPAATNGPGFSLVVEYGVGFGFATGTEFQANVGFRDPRRLISRLVDSYTSRIVDEAETLVDSLPSAARESARSAIPKLRVMLPLATRTAFETGLALAGGSANGDVAAQAVAEAVGREAIEAVLRSVLDFATQSLAEAFAGMQLVDAWVALPDERREDVIAELRTLASSLQALDGVQPNELDRWLPAVLAVVGPLGTLLDLGLLPALSEPEFIDAMAYLFACSTLIERLYRWIAASSGSRGPPFGADQVSVPNNSPVAAHIAARIAKPAGSALTESDLVAFLVGGNPIASVRQLSPVAGGLIDWFARIFQVGSDDQLLELLLSELLPPSTMSVQSLLQRLGEEFGDALTEDVLPRLLTPIKDNADEQVGSFIDRIVIPQLAAVPAVILPQLTHLDDAAIVRFREAISAVVIQIVAEPLLAVLDVLLDHALTTGHEAIRAVGDQVEELGKSFPAFGAVATLASRALLPISINPDDLSGLLRLAADVTERWNDNYRDDFFRLLRTLFELGMAGESSREQTLSSLMSSDAPARPRDLELMLDTVRDSTIDMVVFAAPRLLELMAMHFVNEAKTLAVAIYEGAKAVVAAVEQAAAWLAGELDKLRKTLEDLTKGIARLGAEIAGDIAALAEHLKTLGGAVLDSIQASGWSTVKWLIPDWVPGWGIDSIKAIYDGLFIAAKTLLTAPLTLLNVVATWVGERLTAIANGSFLNAQSIKNDVSNRIYATGAVSLDFTIEVDLGFTKLKLPTASIPAGTVLWAIAATVLGDSLFDQTINGCASDANQLQQLDAQRVATELAINKQLSGPEATQLVNNLTTGHPLEARINWPPAMSGHGNEVNVDIDVTGANRTFVDPPLGVPRRIAIRLNGREYDYSDDRWTDTPTGLRLQAVVPLPAEPATLLSPASDADRAFARRESGFAAAPIGVEIAAGTPLVRTADEAARIEFADASAPPIRIAAAPAPAPSTPPDVEAPNPSWATHPEPAGSVVAHVVQATVTATDLVAAEPPSPSGILSAAPNPDTVRADFRTGSAVALHAALDAAKIPTGVQPLPPTKTLVGQRGVNVLQIAVSDGHQQTHSASVIFYLGTHPTPPQGAIIVAVEGNPSRRARDRERVVIQSVQAQPLDMTGWVLRDLVRNEYTFPQLVLAAGEQVRVWTGDGVDDGHDIYWSRNEPVWNNAGDTVVLYDQNGRENSRLTNNLA